MHPKITVIDSIMGSGKTTYVLKMLNEMYAEEFRDDVTLPRVLFITPRLTEVQRVKDACPLVQFREPDQQMGKGSKFRHLQELLNAGENVVTTHTLFSMIDRETQEALEEAGYWLIVDEETEWTREWGDLHEDDLRAMFEAGQLYTGPDKRVRWNYELYPNYKGDRQRVKNLCDNGSLIRVDESFFVWEFPAQFIRHFERVYLLTYLFEGSLLSSYFKLHGLDYETQSIGRDGLPCASDKDAELAIKQELRRLVTVVDHPKLNAIGAEGTRNHPLSKRWFQKDRRQGGTDSARLRKHLQNFFTNYVEGGAKAAMWSCFKDDRARLKGNGYASGWTECNLRATNDHRHRKNLAYCCNVFMRPRLRQYFKDAGVDPDQDQFALSQLVQWVWRSQIRDGRPITVYLPSERMRTLFLEWLSEEASPVLSLVA